VDNILNENNPRNINNIITLFYQDFRIKNLRLTYFLGIEVARNKIGIHLSKRKYTLDLLEETGMLACATVPTPMVHFARFYVKKGFKLNEKDSSSYRRLIGRLIYLTNPHPDIASFFQPSKSICLCSHN